MHQPVLCAKDTQATVCSVLGEDQGRTIANPIARGPGVPQQAPSGSTSMDTPPMLSLLAPPMSPGPAPRSFCAPWSTLPRDIPRGYHQLSWLPNPSAGQIQKDPLNPSMTRPEVRGCAALMEIIHILVFCRCFSFC